MEKQQEIDYRKANIIISSILFLIFGSLLWASTASHNPYYKDFCFKTNYTALSIFTTDENDGYNGVLPFKVDCIKNLCLYNPDVLGEEYREEVCEP